MEKLRGVIADVKRHTGSSAPGQTSYVRRGAKRRGEAIGIGRELENNYRGDSQRYRAGATGRSVRAFGAGVIHFEK